jgi:2-dehydropantoate 2-reductase
MKMPINYQLRQGHSSSVPHCSILRKGEKRMRVAILGAGSMGSLFGGYLSQHHEVWLIDSNRGKVDAIRSKGVTIQEPDGDNIFHPNAVSDTSGLDPMDLVIVFVKAIHSQEALRSSRHLIGGKTYLMSLQNGAGHEDTLSGFIARNRLIIGTTQHNSSLTMPGRIHHGGGGSTRIGLLEGDSAVLEPIAEEFRKSGLDTAISDNIQREIWKKLFLNASASALTAILQVKLGYIVENAHAWILAQRLIEEAVAVARADNQDFDPEQVIADIRGILVNASEGFTSIYADIRNGVRTEVDVISGFVVRTAKRLGVAVPNHEVVVELIHALEEKLRSG